MGCHAQIPRFAPLTGPFGSAVAAALSIKSVIKNKPSEGGRGDRFGCDPISALVRRACCSPAGRKARDQNCFLPIVTFFRFASCLCSLLQGRRRSGVRGSRAVDHQSARTKGLLLARVVEASRHLMALRRRVWRIGQRDRRFDEIGHGVSSSIDHCHSLIFSTSSCVSSDRSFSRTGVSWSMGIA
jgi:hypothetical protein